MSGIEKYAKNAILLSGGVLPQKTNAPGQYDNRQKQYYDAETRRFVRHKAKYASDFVVAQVQGLLTGDKNEWNEWRIRFADVVRPTAAIQRHFDDYKEYLFESDKIDYVSPGTKIVTMGSTWLVLNPNNISGASGTGIARRCNAVWNHLDYYGNVVSEPIIAETDRANANDSDVQQSIYITKGYFNVTCQYNENTTQIDTNTRMILGTAAYRVTGFSDFEQEFTADYSTVRLLHFTVRYEEAVSPIDDMENHVAGGKAFKWDVGIAGQTDISAGRTVQLSATSERNDQDVVSTAEHPIDYLWESSDESVATVDSAGRVTAVAEGEASITATLAQNTAQSATVTVTVTASEDGPVFTSFVPYTLSYGESTTLSAAYFQNGEETGDIVDWSLSGAEEGTYVAAIDETNDLTISCYGYSRTPLTVTISCNGKEKSEEIDLEGI